MTVSLKYKASIEFEDITTHGTAVSAGNTQIYSKSTGVYMKQGTTETQMWSLEPTFNKLTVDNIILNSNKVQSDTDMWVWADNDDTGGGKIQFATGTDEIGKWSSTGLTIGSWAEANNTLDIDGEMVIGSGYVGSDETAPTDGMIVEGNAGFGTASPETAFHLFGGMALNHKNKTASYTLTDSDLWVSFSGSSLTATLPEYASGSIQSQVFLIKNVHSSNNLTVATTGSSTIDGNATVTLNAKEAIFVGWGGTNWQVLLHFNGSI